MGSGRATMLRTPSIIEAMRLGFSSSLSNTSSPKPLRLPSW